MLEQLFIEVISISFFAAVFIGLLLLIEPLLRKRYRARWRCVLWTLIAIRLLLPIPLMPLINFSLPAASTAIAEESHSQVAYVQAAEPAAQAGIYINTANRTYFQNITNTASAVSATERQNIPTLRLLAFIWLAGVLIFLLAHLAAQCFFYHRLRTAWRENVPDYISEILEQQGREMGLSKIPGLIISSAVEAPLLVGLLKTRILLPHSAYSNEELAFIFRHELIHYRQFDMHCKCLLFMANALHWFNFTVYLLKARAAKDTELACDEDVVKGFDKSQREQYGSALLNAMPRAGRRRGFVMASTHFGNGKRQMKSRLRNLFDSSRKRRGLFALCLIMVCALAATSAVRAGGSHSIADLDIENVEALATGYEVLTAYYARDFRGQWDNTNQFNFGGERVFALDDIPVTAFEHTHTIIDYYPNLSYSWSYSYSVNSHGLNGNIDFHIPRLAAGQAIAVKRLDFEPGQIFSFTAATENGESIAIGITGSPHLTSMLQDGTWWQFYVSGPMISDVIVNNFDGSARYLYIGNNAVYPVENIRVSLTLIYPVRPWRDVLLGTYTAETP